VTGPSSSCVPWSHTPPETIPSSPQKKPLAGDGWCLQGQQDPRHPGRQGTPQVSHHRIGAVVGNVPVAKQNRKSLLGAMQALYLPVFVASFILLLLSQS
jgi:hypothetical protein